jgi:hypothetical protein
MVIGDVRLIKPAAGQGISAAVNILVAVFSPAYAWTLRAVSSMSRRRFPHHTFHDAWDVDTLRAVLPDADVAFSRPSTARRLRPSRV